MRAISTQVQQKQTKSLKLDYFLYSCFEFEQTCKATPSRSLGEERWPPMVAHFEGEGETFHSMENLESRIKACLNWYKEKFPNLSIQQKLSLANISGIIPGIVFIGLDLKTLYAESNEFEKLIYLEINPDKKLWSQLEQIIQAELPHFAHELTSYLKWIYIEKQPIHWEIGSRPPVGRYAPSARKPQRSSPQSSNNQRPRNSKNGNRTGAPGGFHQKPDRQGGSGKKRNTRTKIVKATNKEEQEVPKTVEEAAAT